MKYFILFTGDIFSRYQNLHRPFWLECSLAHLSQSTTTAFLFLIFCHNFLNEVFLFFFDLLKFQTQKSR